MTAEKKNYSVTSAERKSRFNLVNLFVLIDLVRAAAFERPLWSVAQVGCAEIGLLKGLV